MQRSSQQIETGQDIEISPQLGDKIKKVLKDERERLDRDYETANFANYSFETVAARTHRDNLVSLEQVLESQDSKTALTHQKLKQQLEDLKSKIVIDKDKLKSSFLSKAHSVIDEAIQEVQQAAQKAAQAEAYLKGPTAESEQKNDAQGKAQAQAAELKFKEPTPADDDPAKQAAKKIKEEVIKLLAKEAGPLAKKYGIDIQEGTNNKTKVSFEDKKDNNRWALKEKERDDAKRRVQAIVDVFDDIQKRKIFSPNELQQKLVKLKVEIKPAIMPSGLLSRANRFFAVGKGNIDKAIELVGPKEPKQSFVARLLNKGKG